MNQETLTIELGWPANRWTDTEIATLRDHYGKCPVRDVAKLLNRSAGAVRNKAYDLKITNPPLIPETMIAELRALYEAAGEGGVLGLNVFARKWGVGSGNLCRLAKSLGLSVNQRRKKVKQRKDAPKYGAVGSEALRAALSANAKSRIAKNGHPRGMLGKKHKAEVRRHLGEKSAAYWAGLTVERRQEIQNKMQRAARAAGPAKVTRGTWRADWRTIGGKRNYYRSRWEANYARWLQLLQERGDILSWEHEPKVFWFENILRGVRSYKPDFCVQDHEGEISWHEVKGWMDARSVTCLKRFAKYYPDEILVLIREGHMRSLLKGWAEAIPGWEYDARGRP